MSDFTFAELSQRVFDELIATAKDEQYLADELDILPEKMAEVITKLQIEKCVGCGVWLDTCAIDGDGFCADCSEEDMLS